MRSIRRRQDQREAGINGQLRRVAIAFIQIWASIVISDLFVFAAGVGLLEGDRPLGYLLAAMPLTSILVGVFALRGFD